MKSTVPVFNIEETRDQSKQSARLDRALGQVSLYRRVSKSRGENIPSSMSTESMVKESLDRVAAVAVAVVTVVVVGIVATIVIAAIAGVTIVVRVAVIPVIAVVVGISAVTITLVAVALAFYSLMTLLLITLLVQMISYRVAIAIVSPFLPLMLRKVAPLMRLVLRLCACCSTGSEQHEHSKAERHDAAFDCFAIEFHNLTPFTHSDSNDNVHSKTLRFRPTLRYTLSSVQPIIVIDFQETRSNDRSSLLGPTHLLNKAFGAPHVCLICLGCCCI